MAVSLVASVSVDIGVQVGKWVQEQALKASPYLSKAVNATLSWTRMDRVVSLFTSEDVGWLASEAAVQSAYKESSKFVTKELNKLADSMKTKANSTETGTISQTKSMIASISSVAAQRGGVSVQSSRSQSTAVSARTNPLAVYDTTTTYQRDTQRAAG